LISGKESEEADWKALFEKTDPKFKYLGAKRPTGFRMMLIEVEWQGKKEK
jgi:hypothetical protein